MEEHLLAMQKVTGSSPVIRLENKMNRKKALVTAVVGLVVAALTYWLGADVVSMVKEQLEVAPVTTDTAPVDSED